MERASGSGKLMKPRETRITSVEDDGLSETEKELGGLGSASAKLTSSLEIPEESCHPKQMSGEAELSNRDVGYGFPNSRPKLESDQGSILQPSNSNVVQRAQHVKGTPARDSKGISHEPPVTKLTLGELDIPRIVYNPKLRHDVNFDPELHFRPNLDGEVGRRKAQKAGEFWNGLQAQIEDFLADPIKFESELEGREWSLKSTLRAIREILGTLVPPEDRSSVEEILDVEFLMQQFRKSAADLETLGSWLARTLKSHCAPMRDEWVDEMVRQLADGGRERDVISLVQGLQSLLGVLEAMKLDVANHQIRCLRPLLIKDTVEFEQTFFMKRIALRKIDVTGAYAWFQAAKLSCNDEEKHVVLSHGDLWAFFTGFAGFLLPSKMDIKIPDTFMFDEDRIEKLRADILDAINLDVCIRLLDSAHSEDHSQETRVTSLDVVRPRSPVQHRLSTSSSRTYKGSFKPTRLHIKSKFPKDIKVSPFSRANAQFLKQGNLDEYPGITDSESEDDEEEGSDIESSSSTRRTSVSSAISSPLPRPMDLPAAVRDPRISRSILVIVNDASGKNRWQESYSNIALELLRPSPSHNDLSKLESQLSRHLSNPASPIFRKSESYILAQLYLQLSDYVTQYTPLSATQLFEVATTSDPLRDQSQVLQLLLCDIARHIAHVGTLHWRVWAPLVYLVDPEDAGHVTGIAEPEVRTADKAQGQLAKNDHRPIPQRQNSTSESIPTSSS